MRSRQDSLGAVPSLVSEPVAQASVQFAVADPGGAKLAGTTALSADQKTATWTAAAPMATGTAYGVTVTAADTSSNPLASPAAWSFTTVAGQTCPPGLAAVIAASVATQLGSTAVVTPT